MLRVCACAAAVLALGAGQADKAVEDGKKGQTLTGVIKKVDPSANMIIVTLRTKDQPEDRIVKVGKSFRAVIYAGRKKEELSGKAIFKSPGLKEGAPVKLFLDEDAKPTGLHVGTPGKTEKKEP